MKSLERRYCNIVQKNPGWSSYICFAEAVTNQNFNRKAIKYWFNKLVEKADYDRSDKKAIFIHLEYLNNPIEEGTK